MTAETSLAIFTSNSSTGPFEFASYGHTLGSVGDFAVQQDENSTVCLFHLFIMQRAIYPFPQKVWIAYSSNFFGNATLEKLTDDWLNGSGIASAIPVTFVEAHGMTVVDNEWYWTVCHLRLLYMKITESHPSRALVWVTMWLLQLNRHILCDGKFTFRSAMSILYVHCAHMDLLTRTVE